MSSEKIKPPALKFTLPVSLTAFDKQLQSRLKQQTHYFLSLDYKTENELVPHWILLKMATSPYLWAFILMTRLLSTQFLIFCLLSVGLYFFRKPVLAGLKRAGRFKNRLLHQMTGMPFQETSRADYEDALHALEQLRLLENLIGQWRPYAAPRSEVRGLIRLSPQRKPEQPDKANPLPTSPLDKNGSESKYKVAWASLSLLLINEAELNLELEDEFEAGYFGTRDYLQRVMTASMGFDGPMPYQDAVVTEPVSKSQTDSSVWREGPSRWVVQCTQSGAIEPPSGAQDAQVFFDAFQAAYLKLEPFTSEQALLFTAADLPTPVSISPLSLTALSPEVILAETQSELPSARVLASEIGPTSEGVELSEKQALRLETLTRKANPPLRHIDKAINKPIDRQKSAVLQASSAKANLSPATQTQQASPHQRQSRAPELIRKPLLAHASSKPIIAMEKHAPLFSPVFAESPQAIQVPEALALWLKKSLLSPKLGEHLEPVWLLEIRGQALVLEPTLSGPWRVRIRVPRLDAESAELLLQANPGFSGIAFSRDRAGLTYLSSRFDPSLAPAAIDASLKPLMALAQSSRFLMPHAQLRPDLTRDASALIAVAEQLKLGWEAADTGIWLDSPTPAQIIQVITPSYQTGLLVMQAVASLHKRSPEQLEQALIWNHFYFSDLALGMSTIKGDSALVLSYLLIEQEQIHQALSEMLARMLAVGLTFEPEDLAKA